MERADIRAFLGYPDSGLVNHAISRANLTASEQKAVRLRELDGLTIFDAAYAMPCSETTLKKYYGSGMDKLDKCWSGLPWVNTIIKQ